MPSSVSPARTRRSNTLECPRLVPCLLLGKGAVYLPGPEGPVEARDPAGAAYDLFDVVDRLTARYKRLYVVDLEGIDHNQPQLDYLQEIARDADVWLDAGPRTADQVIDVLVTGARRAVLSTAWLKSSRELRKAWKLSTDIVFEIEMVNGHLGARDPSWSGATPVALAQEARALGIVDIVLSPREADVDWALVRDLSRDGAVWVDGSFESNGVRRLADAGAAGGIFHITEELEAKDGGKEEGTEKLAN